MNIYIDTRPVAIDIYDVATSRQLFYEIAFVHVIHLIGIQNSSMMINRSSSFNCL